jgi:hypothetical protein
MKRFILIIYVLTTVISCCKEEDPIPPDPCETPIKPIISELFNFLPDSNYSILFFKDQDTLWEFNQMILHHDTVYSPDTCNPASERLSLTYKGNTPVNEINYFLSPDSFVYINVGPDNSCESTFFIAIDGSFNYQILDTLMLNNEMFFDAYHLTPSFGVCCTEIYYNKQYGVVGFNWLGEWYVLETDSL